MFVNPRNYKILLLILLLVFTLHGCATRVQPLPVEVEEFEEVSIPMDPIPLPPPLASPAAAPPISKTKKPTADRYEAYNKKKQTPLIVIDAGHGGKDPGAQSIKAPKYQEKSLTLATALMTSKFLQQMGYRTALTRTDDVFVSLQNRAMFANKLRPKLFVSIHYNAAVNNKAEGIEIYYYDDSEKNAKRTTASKALGQTILKALAKSTKAKMRTVQHGDYAVIRETHMTAVLVEGGFLTNPKEREKLLDKKYLRKIAFGIAQGIDDFIKKK